jgi:hypothetical protein
MKDELASFGFGTTLETVLAKRSFVIDSYQPHDPTYFGNTMLLLSNNEARLRFVRDRGDDFVDFGPRVGEEWFGLRHIVKLVAPTLLLDDQVRLKFPLEETVAQLLDSHWNRVVDLFAQDNLNGTRTAISAFKETEVAGFLKSRGQSTRR